MGGEQPKFKLICRASSPKKDFGPADIRPLLLALNAHFPGTRVAPAQGAARLPRLIVEAC
jgi:hypothetical protein